MLFLGSCGVISSITDGIVWVTGLGDVFFGEVLYFIMDNFIKMVPKGLVFNLEKKRVGCLLFGSDIFVSSGMAVVRTGKLLEIGVGPKVLGRVLGVIDLFIRDYGKNV